MRWPKRSWLLSCGVNTLASRACCCISALPTCWPSARNGAVSSDGALKRKASCMARLPSNRFTSTSGSGWLRTSWVACMVGLLNRRTETSLHRDRDALAHDHRMVRDVVLVAQHQLQGVLTGLEFERGFGLAGAEMPELLVGRQRCIGIPFAHIHQQVVVARAHLLDAGRCHAHAAQAEHHLHRTAHGHAVEGGV